MEVTFSSVYFLECVKEIPQSEGHAGKDGKRAPGWKLGSASEVRADCSSAVWTAFHHLCQLGVLGPCLAWMSPGLGACGWWWHNMDPWPLSPVFPQAPPCPARCCGRWISSGGCTRSPQPGSTGSSARTPSWSSSGSARPRSAAGASPVTTRSTCTCVPVTSPSAARRRPMRIRWGCVLGLPSLSVAWGIKRAHPRLPARARVLKL